MSELILVIAVALAVGCIGLRVYLTHLNNRLYNLILDNIQLCETMAEFEIVQGCINRAREHLTDKRNAALLNAFEEALHK